MKAWIWPSTRAIWSRHDCVTSRAETSRLASFAASSETVSWFSIGKLLDDLWDDEQAAGLLGCVAQRLLVRERRTDFVGAGDVDQRDGVGGRLDVRHVEFLQFFDVAEDSAKLRGELFLLVGRERDACEMRDVFDINFSGSHAAVSSFMLKVSS